MTNVSIPTNPRFVNILGKRYKNLTVASYAGRRGHNQLWECKCDCGGVAITSKRNLVSGNTGSCGCQHGLGKHNLCGTLSNRINNGWSIERAINEPINEKFINRKFKNQTK